MPLDPSLRSRKHPSLSLLLCKTGWNGTFPSRTLDIYQTAYAGNLLLSHTDAYGSPEQSTTQYTYDGVGQLVKQVDPSGRTTEYNYDQWGRLNIKREPWGDDGKRAA